MGDVQSKPEPAGDVETALLEAELFVKYGAHERAIKRLRTALERSPRSIPLRERLREVAANYKNNEESARQCLALASLYIERDDFDNAHDRLLEAKQLDNRINIASGLDAIRRARRPDLRPHVEVNERRSDAPMATLAGDLSAISAFDAIQVIENARLGGVLSLVTSKQTALVFFNEGTIVDVDCAGEKGEAGFRRIVEITSGSFEFQKSTERYPVTIQASSNTNLILDTLRHLDEAKQ
jgi:tetratricopeptide (TPR) repeat protein